MDRFVGTNERATENDARACDALVNGLHRRWAALTAPGQVPDRVLVTPEAIGVALPYAFIAERIAPGIARLRVAGRKVSDAMGGEARGMPLSYMFAPSARDEAGRALDRVFQAPATARLPLIMPRGLGRSALRGQMLLLPVADVTGQVTRALGAVVFEGDVTAPRKINFDPERGAEFSFVSKPAPLPEPSGGHLRLVVDNT